MPFRRTTSRRRFAEYRSRRRAHTPEVSGEALVLAARGDEEAARKKKRTRSFGALLRGFWRLLRGDRTTMAAALATLTVATGLGLVMPASTKFVIDYILTDNPGPAGIPEWLGLPRDPMSLLLLLSGAMLAAALLGVAIGMWGRWQMTQLTKRTQARLRRMAFDHAVRLPLHRVQSIKSGGVASILREDAGGAGELVFSLIYNPWRAIVQLVGTLIILAVVDWRLLAGSLLLLPAMWLSHRAWITSIRPVFRDIRHTRQSIDSRATEAFGGMRVVRGFGRERGEAAQFVNTNHLMLRQEMLAWWRSRIVEAVWAVLIPLASVGVLLYGGWSVLRGTLTIGDVMMFSAYLIMLLSPLETLTATATAVQNNLAGFDRVLDLFAEEMEFAKATPKDGEPLAPVSRETARGRIALERVSFRYPGADPKRPPVIDDVSLDVQPGEVIALIGPSGSGKTTLCNLIARFYDPTEGRVTLDGVDLRRIDVRSYRRLLGIVEQDVFLFDGTVEQNIAYARPAAARDEIAEAARAANADEFIDRLDKGYETMIGERGVRLSGGQKQRIAIARALLADPLILILDEATSNLDSESELLIRRSLERLMRGRTSFVIAHRLSTVRHADRIVVIEDGRIVEVGAHEELLTLNGRGGRYAELLRLQVEGEQAAPVSAS